MICTEQLGEQYDGTTHVRIHIAAATPLGRFLATPTLAELSTDDGEFKSIEGYYRYRRYVHALEISGITDEAVKADFFAAIAPLREMYGIDAIKLGNGVHRSLYRFALDLKLPPGERQADEIQRVIIQKFKANPQFMAIAMSNTLPLASYFENGTLITNDRFDWYPRQVERAVAILKELYQ